MGWAPAIAWGLAARITIAGICIGCHCLTDYFLFPPLYRAGGAGTIAFTVLLVLWIIFTPVWIWSHIATSWRDAGSCYEELKCHDLLDSDGKLVPLPPVLDALPRCTTCGLLKPDRAHHCSSCGRCYFRFDHHCPVVGNCIALNNMKAFMLFLIYTGVMLIIVGAAAICNIVVGFEWVKLMWGLLGGAAIVAAVMVAGFGCSYIPQVCVNRTTLERIARVPEGTFDGGHSQNFRQIFGTSAFAWFFPTKPPISGFTWSGIEDLDHIQVGNLADPLMGDAQPHATADAALPQTAPEP